MKKEILDRYQRTDDGRFVIDISADRVEHLYNHFDRNAPYIRKELDQNLVDYLSDCMREIDTEQARIEIRLLETIDTSIMERVRTSIKNYFIYLKELERQELQKMLRRFLIFLLIGFTIMMLSVWVNDHIDREPALNRVLSEGLIVAAWVSLWEAISTILVDWSPHRRQIRRYKKLAETPVIFNTENQGNRFD